MIIAGLRLKFAPVFFGSTLLLFVVALTVYYCLNDHIVEHELKSTFGSHCSERIFKVNEKIVFDNDYVTFYKDFSIDNLNCHDQMKKLTLSYVEIEQSIWSGLSKSIIYTNSDDEMVFQYNAYDDSRNELSYLSGLEKYVPGKTPVCGEQASFRITNIVMSKDLPNTMFYLSNIPGNGNRSGCTLTMFMQNTTHMWTVDTYGVPVTCYNKSVDDLLNVIGSDPENRGKKPYYSYVLSFLNRTKVDNYFCAKFYFNIQYDCVDVSATLKNIIDPITFFFIIVVVLTQLYKIFTKHFKYEYTALDTDS
eukprot:TRINITY_DN8806_c0_g1_i1.p1 TRINITY_DN8806_c0_g1~~TRINITY_DN8806_c0_g1_i1.p1  ORF type:complete len:306 (-),score=47.28 TRINITY_DN8806_c0_g1_i1:12-929(-)